MCSKYVNDNPNLAKTRDIGEIFNKDEYFAFFCGFASATMYCKIANNGYVSFPITQNNNFLGIDNCECYGFYCDFMDCTVDIEGDKFFLQSLDHISYFMENIGVIGEDKRKDIIDLYKMKSPSISSITK